MLMIIKTNNASHIAINIPTDVADKALPAIANMFENNTTFLSAGYSSLEEVKPIKSIATLSVGLNVEVTVNGEKISLKDLKELLNKD